MKWVQEWVAASVTSDVVDEQLVLDPIQMYCFISLKWLYVMGLCGCIIHSGCVDHS